MLEADEEYFKANGEPLFSSHMLDLSEKFVKEKINSPLDKPAFLVMHGGSGSTQDEIRTAVKNGVIEMNIDTDTQWAYWNGLRQFYVKNEGYLQSQVGNPEGEDKPNKKFYDPRVWIRKAEEAMIKRADESFEFLNSKGSLGSDWKP